MCVVHLTYGLEEKRPSGKFKKCILEGIFFLLLWLIGMEDDGFRWAYVLVVVLICFLMAGTAIFILVPRAVELSSTNPPVAVINVFDHADDHISFYFLVCLCFIFSRTKHLLFRGFWKNKSQVAK